MLQPIEYLEFALQHFVSTEYDLASSGAPTVAPQELGYEAPDDADARLRFTYAIGGRYQVPITNLVPTLGASGALDVVCRGLLGHGDVVAVEQPGYEPLWRVPAASGAKVVRFERAEDPAALMPTLADAKLVLLSNPHNPTTTHVPDEWLHQLAALLGPDRLLVVDEAYRELYQPASTAFGPPNLICINSVTKCLGVPWARAGWISAPADTTSRLRRVEMFSVGAAPPSCFAWGAAAVEQAGWLLERVTRMQQGKRERVLEWLDARREQLAYVEPLPGSLFVWVRHLKLHDVTPHVLRGIEEEGVVVAPGGFFGAPSWFRLAFTLSAERLDEGLERLGRALEV
ncbi:MAG: pyridoxal phosphate-dependent aminotransferase [Polyangiaceae bacterium]|nr:pyridoxal phosphate-dependent aminotransferase [Polyangiaceae bacterium]MCW5790327.1 pyridoxal phosphate-dependent aminotransferase [Polyangiaceae bacterium]